MGALPLYFAKPCRTLEHLAELTASRARLLSHELTVKIHRRQWGKCLAGLFESVKIASGITKQAESLQSPTLTGPPAWGSNTTLVMRKLYIKAVQLFVSHVGRILLDLVLVLTLFSTYNFIK